MPVRSRLAALLAAILLALCTASTANAQDLEADKHQSSWISAMDDWFGTWVVSPLNAVMFFDVVFWDNTLPQGAGIGTVVDDEEVTGWSEAGYVYHPIATTSLDKLPPGTVAGMEVTWENATWKVRETGGGEATLLGTTSRTDDGRLANPGNVKLPIIVLWLVLGACFFTVRMGFVQFWAFRHAVRVTMGAYDDKSDPGEISHFQALTSALSATVGLGNIAGVAIAVGLGGPGAVFWMICAGVLGMASKFTECTLGQLYRVERPDGSVSGGPMHYLEDGLRGLGFGPLGKGLAVLFAVMCIGGSFGGGNMFQANQSFAAVQEVVPLFQGRAWLYGVIMAFCVALVIIGGIRRIGTATSFIVPIMCGIYLLAGSWILVVNAAHVPAALTTIVTEAFSPSGMWGGFVGVLVMGFRRAAFSNEAGVGSASIAHSAAQTRFAVREGIVALLEPFIDTVIVCTMTGLVVVVSETYLDPGDGSFSQGVNMTSRAFATVIEWFPIVLSLAVVMFAYSTMISWSYYGERCATWLFGDRASLPYRVVFLFFVFFGSVFKLGHVLDFSDLMVLGMAFPNIFGAVILSGQVKAKLDEYWTAYKAGQLPSQRQQAA